MLVHVEPHLDCPRTRELRNGIHRTGRSARLRETSRTWGYLQRALLGCFALGAVNAQVAEYERAPIHYAEQPGDDAVTRLRARLEVGEAELEYVDGQGYLPGLLRALGVPTSSQALVFSKTSLQLRRISPRTPRAVYFGDEVYVGYVPGGQMIEITAMDRDQGALFYTLDQRLDGPPRFEQHTDRCLSCHASGRTAGWPGHVVRSVLTDSDGHPLTAAPNFVTTDASPLEERWGGWYVTGTHGGQRHLGNLITSATLRDPQPPRLRDLDLEPGANLSRLPARVQAHRYPSAHSDLVALMVLEHQTHMHNVLTRARYVALSALHRQAERARWDPEADVTTATRRALREVATEVLDALLLRDEARLREPVRGTSAFAAEFEALGPRDATGRSLRQLDLEHRLFRYPCSYLIYSPAFDALPAAVLDVVYERLWRVLTGRFGQRSYYPTRTERQAILDILLATKRGLPPDWGPVVVR